VRGYIKNRFVEQYFKVSARVCVRRTSYSCVRKPPTNLRAGFVPQEPHMKNFFLFLLAGFVAHVQSVAQGSVAALDSKNGFKGYQFGSSLNKCKGLVYDGAMISKYDESFDRKRDWYLNLEDLKTYQAKDKNTAVGDLKIGSPTYYFHNNKLMRVDFSAGSYEGRSLVQLYKSLYGNPKITNDKTWLGTGIVIYTWRGNKVNLTVTYCAEPYQGSTVVNNAKPISSWYQVVYLSLPMLVELQANNNKATHQLNRTRANDL
jgi:hypothetical protein